MVHKSIASGFFCICLLSITLDAPAQQPSSQDKTRLSSSEIDQMLLKEINDSGSKAAPLCDDVDFLRRVYVDLTGRPPLPNQLDAFLEDSSPKKRSRVIRELLHTERYAKNWARYWRDVVFFNATDRRAGLAAPVFQEWMTQQLQDNEPWNEIATDLITATGKIEEDGRTFLIMAQFSQTDTAVNLAAETSRVFMGIQIQCAQCHDHPYDSWKREQFHEMAAFFARTRVRPIRMGDQGRTTYEVVSASERRLPAFAQSRRRRGNGEYQMPDKDDPTKTTVVHPKFILGQEPQKSLGDMERRKLLASYLTSPTNPWFARSLVNRLWNELMGEGFYNPVDDLGPERNAQSPLTLNRIAADFRTNDHDIRDLFELVMNTDAYQRVVEPRDPTGRSTAFTSACAKRLRSDQIYDSLVQALVIGEAQLSRAVRSRRQPGMRYGLRADPTRFMFNTTFGVNPSTGIDDVQGTLPQSLLLMNSPITDFYTSAQGDTLLGRMLPIYEDDHELLDLVYKRVLARKPTKKEIQNFDSYSTEVNDRAEAFEDLLWCLVNSTEFITKR